MLAKALDAVSKQGIGIKWYVGNDTANKLGTKIKDAFLALLEKTPQLDGNDAMHVVTARLMECVMFASTDGDFRFVSDVIVFCENPLSDVR